MKCNVWDSGSHSLKSPRCPELSNDDLHCKGRAHLPSDALDLRSQSACKPIPYYHIRGLHNPFSQPAATGKSHVTTTDHELITAGRKNTREAHQSEDMIDNPTSELKASTFDIDKAMSGRCVN